MEVSAESLYEALARGVSALRASPWVDRSIEFAAFTVTILEQAPVTHKIEMKQLRQWLAARGTSPAQITAKDRVREILGPEPAPTDRAQRRRWQGARNA